MSIVRYSKNPIITTEDVKPSRKDFEVIGVFNPGVAKYGEETILVVRVAERPKDNDEHFIKVPIYDDKNKEIIVKEISRTCKGIELYDPRVIVIEDQKYLTSLSHLRIARSIDGYRFQVENQPAIIPDNIYEAYGIEDARVTLLNGRYYINYSAASSAGITTGLISTPDFKNFKREGIIFCPDNKNVAIFPEKINGKYYALHRPSGSYCSRPEIWIADSNDLICWGNHRRLAGVRPGYWDNGRIGASAVPFRTEHGWVEIYHGATVDDYYCLGVMLLDLNEPWKVMARSEMPFIKPEEEYETEGFFKNVIFSCGLLEDGQQIRLYYGAADKSVACIDYTLDDVLDSVGL